MIRSVFQIGGDQIEVIVRGNELLFFDMASGVMTSLEGIKLSKSGVIKELPELENDKDWRKKAIEQLKKKMKTYKSELEKISYVKEELTKQGYTALYYQNAGFRPKKW